MLFTQNDWMESRTQFDRLNLIEIVRVFIPSLLSVVSPLRSGSAAELKTTLQIVADCLASDFVIAAVQSVLFMCLH